MLQYPVQLPPLSLSSSPKNPLKDNNDRRANDNPRLPPNSLNNKRFQKETFVSRSPFAGFHPAPALPTNLAPIPTSSPSSASPKLPRTPYISRPTSSPISLPNPQPWPSSARSGKSSSASSTVEDVLVLGDFVGEGGTLQGETIRLVSIGGTSPHPFEAYDYREPAVEFQVKKRLGHGSYAVVYLVQEVLYRPPLSDDGHMPTMGMMELDGKIASHPQAVYGREYAIKCLSKANLDEDDLAAQMSEVHNTLS